MRSWGRVARRAALTAVALGTLVFGAEPAMAAVGNGSLVEFREVVQQGDYETGGTGMVGTGAGEIAIAGIPPASTVTEAYLYWVIVASTNDPSFASGTFNGVPITGELVAIGDDPCRDPDTTAAPEWHSFVYRAEVTDLTLPGGNGSYTLTGFATGPLDPTDPFLETSLPPLNEGATLVVLYENPLVESRVIVLYEGALAVEHFELGETTLRFASVVEGRARTTYGVADGQNRFDDETLFNGVVLARNEALNEQSFSGSNRQNMDTDTYDVTALVDAGDTSATVAIGNGDDCLLHFVQVFSAPSGALGPTVLTLSPTTAAVQIGETHTVTATVTTSTGVPVPNTLVQFDVSGSVTTEGSCTTNAAGTCTFTFDGPDLPGTVVITAYADIDKDNTQDPGEPTGAANATFVVPPSTPLCEIKITYGGWIIAQNTDRATFGGNAKADENRSPSGQAEYQDHGPFQAMNVHGDVVGVVCDPYGKKGTIFGRATINGAGMFDFRIDVVDLAEPGTGNDHYRIRVAAYDSGDRVLSGGNVQVQQG